MALHGYPDPNDPEGKVRPKWQLALAATAGAIAGVLLDSAVTGQSIANFILMLF